MIRPLSFAAPLLLAALSLAVLGGPADAWAQQGEVPPVLAPAPPNSAAPPLVVPALPPSPAVTRPDSVAPAPPVRVPEDYRLDTDDTVQVDVARHGDVSRSLRIPADGMVRLPRLLTPVLARGKTCAQLSDLVAKRLIKEGKLVIRPGQVTVSVTGPRSQRVYVRGTAIGGRIYELKNGERISEAVAALGGVTQPDRVTTVLNGPRRAAPITINLDAVLNTPASPENLPLEEGDTLTIDAPRKIRLFIEGEGPRGIREFDQRYGLKQMLVEIGYSASGATGDLRRARIRRKSNPLDPASPDIFVPVNLLRVLTDDAYDVKVQDMDTLQIPISELFIYVFGEVGGSRKVFLPQDRKWYLSDVIANGGGTTGGAKIGSINVIRTVNNAPVAKTYDFGKYLKDLDRGQNPEIQAGDLVFVPNVKRPDVGSIWTTFGLFNLLRSVIPGIPGSF
ncbi:MAG: polysaccharide biosynthesis/export family protein [Cytophagales bacterium]|nr:polysaccharide biosynthesis/export family protein [Armatimonadota bacterium]